MFWLLPVSEDKKAAPLTTPGLLLSGSNLTLGVQTSNECRPRQGLGQGLTLVS